MILHKKKKAWKSLNDERKIGEISKKKNENKKQNKTKKKRRRQLGIKIRINWVRGFFYRDNV